MSEDKDKSIALLERRLKRAKLAQEEAESLLEEKSRELFLTNKELHEINSLLEEKVKERTLEFEAERDKAIAANQAKSQFLANMSHEIRTPLNGMLGFANILKKTKLDDKQMEYLRTIDHSGKLLLSIINDILEFSRIEAGHLSVIEEPFDIRSCVESLVEVLALKAFEKKLEVPISISGNITDEIIGDEGRIRQVLVNLIGNAIKFTHVGEISINVSIIGENLFFEVADTGMGIPQDKQKSIFTAFAQTDESDTRKYGGTGLGLTISKKIVEAMKGCIGLDSTEGRGSRFFFTLPYKPVGEAKVATVNSSASVAVFYKSRTILSNLSHRFKSWGINFEALTNFSPESLEKTLSSTHILIDEKLLSEIDEKTKNSLCQNFAEKSVAVSLVSGHESELSLPDLEFLPMPKPLRRKKLFSWLNGDFDSTAEAKTSIDLKQNALNLDTKDKPKTLETEKKILLVEDNMINQQLAVVVLEASGYSCTVANNGQEAVDEFKKNGSTYYAILMDCQMPVMDGFDATKAIRQLDYGQDVPIIALTANAFRKTQEQCFDVGMNDFLTKPFKEEDIHTCLEKHSKVS